MGSLSGNRGLRVFLPAGANAGSTRYLWTGAAVGA